MRPFWPIVERWPAGFAFGAQRYPEQSEPAASTAEEPSQVNASISESLVRGTGYPM